jgi:hypothetical protein
MCGRVVDRTESGRYPLAVFGITVAKTSDSAVSYLLVDCLIAAS